MSLWRQITRGLRVLAHRTTADQDVADEVQHYFEQAVAAHAARGLSPGEAARAARLELGSVLGVREQVRGSGWENAIETLFADLRFAVRRLRAEPVFTVVTVLTVALGIGATTAIFSAVNPILFEPLPYPQPDRIATIWEVSSTDGSLNGGTFGMYRGLEERTRSFDAIAVFKPWQPTMTGPDQPERLEGQRVSAQYFRCLGVPPRLGRGLQASDDRLHGPNVVILSDRLWRRRFGGDRSIVGRPITLDGESFAVIGVMPKGFENVLAPAAELWAPLQYDMTQGRAWGHHLRTVARLRPGVSVGQASQEVDLAAHAVLKEQRPETYGEVKFVATALHDDVTRGVGPALLAILGAVVLVLVIACVNVTNLLIARGVRRRGEFALRAALGAGRNRLIRQLLTESLLLAAMGGVVGMAVASLGVRALVVLSPPGLPRVGAIGVDRTVLAFGLVITTLTGLAFGLIPALQAARSDPQRELQEGSRRSAGGHRQARGALVVAEVALALVLLVSAGLLLRSLDHLFAVAVGFDSSNLLTMQVQTSGPRFDAEGSEARFFSQALAAVQRVPGVTAAAFTNQLPLSGDLDEYGAHFEASPARLAESYSAFRYAVSPGYLETMRIPLRRSRLFVETDRAGAPLVAIISESLARLRFRGADPIGQRLRIGPMDGPPYTIVGVVADVRQMSLAVSRAEAVYIPASQWPFADSAMSLVIRGRGDAAALAPAVRAAVWSVDEDQPIVRVAMMDSLLAASQAERRFALILFEVFSLAALLLAAAGIYGVMTGSVAERTREIGIRSALGATRQGILALVIRQGMTLTGVGVAIGAAGAAAATRAIAAMLFGVSRLDPVTYLAVIALLAGVAILACGVPAWRAARVDPASTLRAE
ncbi:MAG TPA: ABC transporter permease [Thermoanaerobaculia bacterium]|jgi:putative ABC transport system permease protein|nr:ABC transporter permease [Thermoanaerobaculia bacterium]